MIERKLLESKMVAMQLTTDEGAFICNVDELDVAKVAAKESGAFVVIHHAVRLDAMFGGQYEIHKTKIIETSSIDFYQPFHKRVKSTTRKTHINR
jgi:hypothetical protein